MPGNFEALLGELDLLKSMPADDATMGGADDATAGGDGDGDEGGGDGDGGGDGGEGDEAFGKSFKVTLADGTEAEAYDGTAMMKSLRTDLLGLQGDNEALAKALGGAVEAIKAQREAIISQGTLIKSLQADLAKLAGQGSGRRSVLNVLEKTATTAPASPSGAAQKITPAGFMAKALSLQKTGELNATDVARCEMNLNKFGELPPDLKHLFA